MAGWGWLSERALITFPVPVPAASRGVRYGLLALVGVFRVARNLPGLGVLAPHGRP